MNNTQIIDVEYTACPFETKRRLFKEKNNYGCYLGNEIYTATKMKSYYSSKRSDLSQAICYIRKTILIENEDYKLNQYGKYIYYQSAVEKINNYIDKKTNK